MFELTFGVRRPSVYEGRTSFARSSATLSDGRGSRPRLRSWMHSVTKGFGCRKESGPVTRVFQKKEDP